jgi:stage II sporulation protein D
VSREVFGSDASGGRAVEDGCAGPAWRAELTPAGLASAARVARGEAAAAEAPRVLRAGELALVRGAGGWISRVEAADGSWRVSGDAFARALDAELGRGRVRSGRFELADEGGRVVIRGTGHGHGVGLCQAGAARLAAAGADRRAILRRYYRARVTNLRHDLTPPGCPEPATDSGTRPLQVTRIRRAGRVAPRAPSLHRRARGGVRPGGEVCGW